MGNSKSKGNKQNREGKDGGGSQDATPPPPRPPPGAVIDPEKMSYWQMANAG